MPTNLYQFDKKSKPATYSDIIILIEGRNAIHLMQIVQKAGDSVDKRVDIAVCCPPPNGGGKHET